MKINRQHILLLVLLALAVYVALPFLRQAPGTLAPRGAAVLTAGDIQLPPDFDLDARLIGRPVFSPSGGRNLFAYGQPPRPVTVAPPPVARKPPPPPRALPVQQAAATPPPALLPPPPVVVQPSRPNPPPVHFQYIGYMGPHKARIAVFTVPTEDGKEIALAREGEVPQIGATAGLPGVQGQLDQFRVRSIGYEEVEIGYTDQLFADDSKILLMGGRS